MVCKKCNAEFPDGISFCPNCGESYAEQSVFAAEKPAVQEPVYFKPALKLAVNRSLCKMFFLSIITLGIYGIVNYSRMADEINITASRYDGGKTMPYFVMISLMPITFSIIWFVWFNNFSKRIGNEARRRGYQISFGPRDFWLWNVLGSFILVGPFIYLYRLTKTMNMVNKSYNYYG